MSKLIIASNRLPITVRYTNHGFHLNASNGGLATGLSELMKQTESIWVGWHGCVEILEESILETLHKELRSRKLAAIDLDTDEIRAYYNEVSNAILWPTYHYQIEKMPLDLVGWETYKSVNQKFADRIIALYEDGDFIWIHDYHLQLVPAMVRAALPEARIGFFLHIPFPSVDVFRVLPWRSEILNGIMGADVIGFHTYAYASHFQSCLLRLIGLESFANTLFYDGRIVKFGSFPLGVDVSRVSKVGDSESCELTDSVRGIKSGTAIGKIMLAVDRMDYTKGLPRKLMALEKLLNDNPDLRGKIVLIQIAAPSRDEVPAYEECRESVEGLVGRINGKHGMPGYQPIHYLFRPYPQEEIFALYRLVDIMIVTPLRDGMNLVAKEFIAAREDQDGVLILSEFAGAAEELGESLLINPYDIADTALGMLSAIQMPVDERKTRMKSLRNRVNQFDASEWARRFMDFLHGPTKREAPIAFDHPIKIVDSIPPSQRIVLLLDYDGTLFPIVRVPQLAKPDAPLLNLLAYVSEQDRFETHILSGRTREVLESWFPFSQVHLHAEHGALSRSAASTEWVAVPSHLNAYEWQPFVRTIMEEYTRNTPGSFIEQKTYSLVWHYRMSDPIQGEDMAKMLRVHGRETFTPMGLEVLAGKWAIEVRQVGMNKGMVVTRLLKDRNDDFFPIAIGDDVTDEDMFSAMPASGMTIVVGGHMSLAKHRLRNPSDVRRFLECLAHEPRV